MGGVVAKKDAPRREVSVVIPTHDRSGLLQLALLSVLDQRDVDLEVIVVDDGSSDDTPQVVGRIDDSRVRLVRHDAPLGVSAARNRGIAEARGRWVAFLDDDDIWAPDKLLLQLRALGETGRAWSYTGAVNITLDHRIIGGSPPLPPEEVVEGLPRTNLVPAGCSAPLVLAEALAETGGFDGTYHHFADWDLWIRLARAGPPAWTPGPLVGYRIHPGNASVDTDGMVSELDIIEERYGGPVDRAAFYRHVARVSRRINRQGRAIGYYLRAAAKSRGEYPVRELARDVAGALRGMARRVRDRLGHPRPPRRPEGGYDPHRGWREEARPWVEGFVRRHGREPDRPYS